VLAALCSHIGSNLNDLLPLLLSPFPSSIIKFCMKDQSLHLLPYRRMVGLVVLVCNAEVKMQVKMECGRTELLQFRVAISDLL